MGACRSRLRSRDVIGQAHGVLVSHFALSVEDASGLLVRLSQQTNTKLTVAAAFVARVRDGVPAGPR